MLTTELPVVVVACAKGTLATKFVIVAVATAWLLKVTLTLGTIAVITAPAGIPVPETAIPTAKPEVLAMVKVSLLFVVPAVLVTLITAKSVILEVGTELLKVSVPTPTDKIVVPPGIPVPVTDCPATYPVVEGTVTVVEPFPVALANV